MASSDGERPFFDRTPWSLIALLGATLVAVALLVELALLPRAALAVAAIAAGHGSLLATALSWTGAPRVMIVALVSIVAIAALASQAHPIGSVAYLAPPALIVGFARHGRLTGLGLGTPCPAIALVVGAAIGLFLGAHVLFSATQTLGYRARVELSTFAPAVLYDVGAQVPATELFFRGALFNRAQRRWSFGVAILIATAATVGRYLVDPLLPARAVELLFGALFYISLLAAATGWMYWRFGTIVPGLVASLLFFGCYRALAAR